MSTFIKYLMVIFILSVFASSDNYLLLNDMNFIKEESKIVKKMVREVKERDIKVFSKILDGLISGSDSLNLRGTKISAIRVKLIDIREFWNSKKGSLDSSSLTKIDIEINKVIKLYAKSYNKYLQKQKLATIITQHMNQSKPDRKILALYEKF
jgi:hypothetical protein